MLHRDDCFDSIVYLFFVADNGQMRNEFHKRVAKGDKYSPLNASSVLYACVGIDIPQA